MGYLKTFQKASLERHQKAMNVVISTFVALSYKHYLYSFLYTFVQSRSHQRLKSILGMAASLLLMSKILYILIISRIQALTYNFSVLLSEPQQSDDLINTPAHYHKNGTNIIDFSEAQFSYQELKGFFRVNTIKYLIRYDRKNGVQDLKKGLKNAI